MNESLATVIGMTIAYVASLLGLVLAWYGYRKHGRGREEDGPQSPGGPPPEAPDDVSGSDRSGAGDERSPSPPTDPR